MDNRIEGEGQFFILFCFVLGTIGEIHVQIVFLIYPCFCLLTLFLPLNLLSRVQVQHQMMPLQKAPRTATKKHPRGRVLQKKGEAQFVFHVRMFLRRLHQLTFYDFSALHFPAGETREGIWSGRGEWSPQPFTYVVNDFILLLISWPFSFFDKPKYMPKPPAHKRKYSRSLSHGKKTLPRNPSQAKECRGKLQQKN